MLASSLQLRCSSLSLSQVHHESFREKFRVCGSNRLLLADSSHNAIRESRIRFQMSTRIGAEISVPVVKVGRHPKTSALAINCFLQRTKGANVRVRMTKLRAQLSHEPEEAKPAKSEATGSTNVRGDNNVSKAKDLSMVYPVKYAVIGLLVHVFLSPSSRKVLTSKSFRIAVAACGAAVINEVIPDFAKKINPLNQIFGLPKLFLGLWKDYQDLLEEKKKGEEEKKKIEEEKGRGGEKQN